MYNMIDKFIDKKNSTRLRYTLRQISPISFFYIYFFSFIFFFSLLFSHSTVQSPLHYSIAIYFGVKELENKRPVGL